MKKIILTFLLILFLISCKDNFSNSYSPKVFRVLKFCKGNASEIKKALDYFILKGDTEEIKAITFLVENMKDKYAIVPEISNDPYHNIIIHENVNESQAWDDKKSQVGFMFDSLRQKSGYIPQMKIIYDLDVVKSDFLIENVEIAFKMWKKMSKQNCKFEDFCEYILPYRIEHEPLSNWRKDALKQYSALLDSANNTTDLAKLIIKKSKIHYNAGMSKYPYVPTFKELYTFRWGSCVHLADYLTLSLRALGIACTTDKVLAWANRSSGHQWTVVMDREGKFFDVGFNSEGKNDITYKYSKIYRTTFSDNLENKEFDLTLKDVTANYKLPVSNIILTKKNKNHSSYFLCTFNNTDWEPIALGINSLDNGKVIFKNMGRGIPYDKKYFYHCNNEGKGIVYLPIEVNNGVQISGSYPFILKENGICVVLKPNLKKTVNIILHRKYPLYDRILDYSSNMIGGFFESSTYPDFSNTKVVYKIKKKSDKALSEIKLPHTIACNSIRYVAPLRGGINLSELHFYYQNKEVKGSPFSSDKNEEKRELNRLFDKNLDTYFSSEIEKAYIGVNFKKRVKIDKIVYAPRTDNNDILSGMEYELFYWNNGWISLGRKKTNKNFIEYMNVPTNALFLLHKISGGLEERIFTYNCNSQIWW